MNNSNKPQPSTGKKTLASVVGAGVAAILLGTAGHTGFTEKFEGMVLRGYLDPVGIPTKCAGDTYDVVVGKRYSMEECKASLEQGLIKHAEPVLKCAPYLKDIGYPFFLAAAIDQNYHTGQFCNTSMDREFRAGNYQTACIRFNERPDGKPQWIYAKGKVLPGLVKRAAARRELCTLGLQQYNPA